MLSSNSPSVSLLIRSMDRDHLHTALASADAQTYAPLHIIVVNASGHKHRPLPVLATPCELVESSTPLNRAEAANAALEATQTPLAMFLDDDDLIDPHHVSRLVEALSQHPGAPAAYSGVRLEQSDGQFVSTMDSPWVPGELLVHNTLPIHSVLFQMQFVTPDYRFDTQFSQLEDWDFWLQLSRQGSFVHVPGASATYRMALGKSGLSEQRDISAYHTSRTAVWNKWLPHVDVSLLQKGLASLVDRFEQLEWDIEQLHASERSLQQQDHERHGQLVELREHYEKLQELHSELHREHGAVWERFNTLQREHHHQVEYFKLLQNENEALEARIDALRHSRSMRLTRPLRWITNQLRDLRTTLRNASQESGAVDNFPIARATQKQPRGAVDIIVPVYKGLEETQACLESVWSAKSSHSYRLIVINDASPEPEVTTWLREAAKTQAMELLENEQNLGFVGTVNRGMAYSDSADVVLLNSDAEVANDWLDRLISAAYRPTTRPAASVTPFSNNATICSYPRFCEDNQLPEGYELPALDRLFADTNAGQTVEIPTGIGFCMYIRREALDAVGLFDVENFGKGYGEENDFCMRTLKAGWCHLHALDVFAWHKGSVSFGESQPERVTQALKVLHDLHPDYESRVHRFIQHDPARKARLAIDVARLRASQKPRILMVNHQRGGGTERHCQELADTLKNEVEWLMLRPSPMGGARLTMLDESEAMALDYALPEELDELVEMLKALGVIRVHFHHWLGFDASVLNLAPRLGVAQDVTLHDYYAVCPQISMSGTDNRYCGEGEQCLCYSPEQPASNGLSIAEWRERHAAWLLASERVITPSHDTATRIKRYIPDLDITVAVHPDQEKTAYPSPTWKAPDKSAPLRVAVIGALSAIKGADVLESVALEASKRGLNIEFKLFGFAYRSLKASPNLTVSGPYRDDELEMLLGEWQPHIAWFPPLWPETYSYTLSTCLMLGLPVVSTDLGALPERLHGRPYSWVLDWKTSTSQWCSWFSTLKERTDPAVNEIKDNSWTGSSSTFYNSQYLGSVELPLQTAPLPAAWQAHVASADTNTMRVRKALVSSLYWLRAQPLLRGLSRHVPASWQRKVKSRLLRES